MGTWLRVPRSLRPETVVLLCYRCGGTDAEALGVSPNSGRIGKCRKCTKRFTQGGRNELAKYHLVLEARVRGLGLPREVEAEAMQLAVRDVIEGKGYCWSVAIRQADAWRAVRGEYGQRGSDHPEYRRQQGQGPINQGRTE